MELIPELAGTISVGDIAASIAGIAGVAAIVVSVLTFRHNRQHATATRQQAIDFQGTGLCLSYREHVIALHDRGMNAEEIRALLAHEDGQKMSPEKLDALRYERTDLPGGTLEIEYGCATIDEIIQAVPRRSPDGPGSGGSSA